MASDRLDALLDGVAHVCAAIAVGWCVRTAAVGRGWTAIPIIERLDDAPSLSIVVPARDEERAVERCVRSLLAQRIADLEVIVVDDGSTDATPAILARLAAGDPRLRVVRGAPLPEGWVGKSWAAMQGARLARGAWLLFTDADTVHDPRAAISALAAARAHDVDALTIATGQELETWAERAILPAMLGTIFVAAGSGAALNDPYRPAAALANGQYLLVRRAAYDALGGHAALRATLIEDVAFARRLKADGRYRLRIADGERLVGVRMYRSLREIVDGFTKNLYAGAEGDARRLLAAGTALAALSVIPAGLAAEAAARRRPVRAAQAVLVLAAGAAAASAGLARTTLPRRLAWWAPIGYAACGAILLNSTLRVVTGRGVAWRGRTYRGAA